MKDVAIVVLAGVAAFLLWNQSSVGSYDQDTTQHVSPDVIQVIIEAVQKDDPDLEPLETIFITPTTDNTGMTVYTARFMFFNTRGFFGIQYDVVARESSDRSLHIVSKSGSVGVDREGPFQTYRPDKYLAFKDVDDSLDAQMKSLLNASKRAN
jgi:hypothetical protein